MSERVEGRPDGVLVVLGADDDQGLLAAVTHCDGGQELVEVGTPGCHLQPGGGSQ